MSEGSGVGHPLDAVFLPRSVVVVGASTDPKKRGYQVLRALRESGYEGEVYGVNPRGGEILGFPVFPSVDEVPGRPDLALVCTPASTVPGVVEACGRKGVGGAVVLAVGFRESGEEGAALEARVLDAARSTGIRVVGPNTSGILNLPLGLNLIGARGVRPGSLSLLVQSGNMALALMNEVTARTDGGIGICVGVGNELDLGFHEYLDFLGHHDETRAVVVYVEGFRDARAFLQVAARVVREKPVLLLKGGRSGAGAEAARSHTGAVSGEYDRLRAGLIQAGVVEVTRTDEILHLADTLANQPAVRDGAGIAILSDGGGQGTLASDALSDLGVPLAKPAEATRAALRELLGPAAATRNPVDLAGAADADPEMFGAALEVLAADPAVGGVMVVGLFGGYGIRFADELVESEMKGARRMADAMAELGKPLVVHSMYAGHRSEPLRVLTRAGVPVVESLDVACRCVAAVHWRGHTLGRPGWEPDSGEGVAVPGAGVTIPRAAAHEVVARARRDGREALTEPEARALLEEAGMPFPPASLCRTADEVAEAVASMETAVALKVVSPKIAHKTEAGGVALGITGPEEGARVFTEMVARTGAYLESRGLPPGIEGVLVTPMLAQPVAEFLVGARRDPDVGPVLTLGAGGIWVEVLRDVAHRVLPVADDDILAMLAELRTYGLLTGARGTEHADLGAVVVAARSVARCIADHPEVAEVEVNPLFVYAHGVEAVDARIFLTSGSEVSK